MSSSLLSASSLGPQALQVGGSALLRYPPEPRSTVGQWASAATSAAKQVASVAFGGGIIPDPTTDLAALLQQQIQIQLEMQVWTARSNIARSEHEIQMAPVRNMRVG